MNVMNILCFVIFLAGLGCCIVNGVNILWALGGGLFLFSGLALNHTHSLRAVWDIWLEGVLSVANILIIFIFIGMLTGSWRGAGTIAQLISWALPLVDPKTFALWVFLLCACVSLLLGTAFGSVSTLGVIFMMLARTAGLNEYIIGGAVISGIYVGDRCSPMSSSAALVCSVTQTAIYKNISGMWRTSVVPLLLTGLGYWLLAGGDATGPVQVDAVTAELEERFRLGWIVVLPAMIVIVLSFARIDVKKVMAASVIAACAICLWWQNVPLQQIVSMLLFGYVDSSMDTALSGGGIMSMVMAGGIVLLSSPYAALFRATRLLYGLEGELYFLARRIGSFTCLVLACLPIAMICCNQMLTVLMGAQTCRHLFPKKQDLAIALENSAILLPVLIPWNIASNVPCSTLGIGAECLPFALYPIMVPLVNLLTPFVFRYCRRQKTD